MTESRPYAVPARLEKKLKAQLLAIPYPAFAEVVRTVIEKDGCVETRVVKTAAWGARNGDGGVDITGCVGGSLVRIPIIAQAKQYTSSVQKQHVDLLRGAMIRTGAQLGMIVTTADFAQIAVAAASEGQHIPVVLLDGHELISLMVGHGIGVTALNGRRTVDKEYFDKLKNDVANQRQCRNINQPVVAEADPLLTLTICYGAPTACLPSRRCGS